MSILLKNALLPDKNVTDILIEDGYLKSISSVSETADSIIDLRGKYVLPGIIDPHAHLRDMELSSKEDWYSGSRAAAAGGITTTFDMPNTNPATFDKESLESKRRAAAKSLINYSYNFGINNTNLSEINKDLPISALKMFMAESSSGRVIDNQQLIRDVFKVSKKIGKPVIVHSELQSCVEEHEKRYSPKIENHNKIRNRDCAIKSTEILIELAIEIGNVLYLAHVSTAEEIELIRQAKKDNHTNILCEITPHHLLINERILSSVGNWGKVNPPLRTARDNSALLEGIMDGTVDTFGSDHAPHTLEEKSKDYAQAPSGFPGFETMLPLFLTEFKKNNLSLQKIVELSSENPAEIFQIKKRGKLKEGYYADLTIVDLDRSWTVKPDGFQTKAKYSPYNGMKLHGEVFATMVNGRFVYKDKQFFNHQGKEIEFR